MPKKRPHGAGGVYKREYPRKDGKVAVRWVAEIDLPPGPNGERRRWRAVFEKKREAEEAVREKRDDRDAGIIVVGKQNVGQYLAHWLEDRVKPHRSANTYTSYERNCRLYIVPALGRYRLTELAPPHVQRFLNDLLKRGKSPRLVQLNRAILCRALNQALAWRQVRQNVAALTEIPETRNRLIKPLRLDQAIALLDVVRGHRLEALVVVTLAVGLRESEALGLRWEDVDLDAATLDVRMQVQNVEGKLCLVALKTDKSHAVIALPDFAVEALREHKLRQREERLKAGPRWRDHCLVFPSRVGTPQSRHNVYRTYKRLVAQAGLPETVRFHDLRHTTGTLLRSQGIDLKTIQETLRHANLSTTADIYTHYLADVQRKAARAMDKLFRNARRMPAGKREGAKEEPGGHHI